MDVNSYTYISKFRCVSQPELNYKPTHVPPTNTHFQGIPMVFEELIHQMSTGISTHPHKVFARPNDR